MKRSMENKNNGEFKNIRKNKQKDADNQKKPFNKKKYRQQKYSNKFKVNQWEEKRKKAILKSFYKDLKKDENISKFKFSTKNDSSNPSDDANDLKNKRIQNPFFSAKQEYRKKQQEKRKKKEEILKANQEKEEALKKYKEKKLKTFKQLTKKTKKGQPVMRGRMELLLEKIQQSL